MKEKNNLVQVLDKMFAHPIASIFLLDTALCGTAKVIAAIRGRYDQPR